MNIIKSHATDFLFIPRNHHSSRGLSHKNSISISSSSSFKIENRGLFWNNPQDHPRQSFGRVFEVAHAFDLVFFIEPLFQSPAALFWPDHGRLTTMRTIKQKLTCKLEMLQFAYATQWRDSHNPFGWRSLLHHLHFYCSRRTTMEFNFVFLLAAGTFLPRTGGQPILWIATGHFNWIQSIWLPTEAKKWSPQLFPIDLTRSLASSSSFSSPVQGE